METGLRARERLALSFWSTQELGAGPPQLWAAD
jgi:hypothetical protein